VERRLASWRKGEQSRAPAWEEPNTIKVYPTATIRAAFGSS